MAITLKKIHGFTDTKEAYDAVGFGTNDLIIKEYSVQPSWSGINNKKVETFTFDGSGAELDDFVVISIMQGSINTYETPYLIKDNKVIPSAQIVGTLNGGELWVRIYSDDGRSVVKVKVVLLRVKNRG